MDLGNVFVINLDKDTHKWENIQREFGKYNIKYHRFPAIYGKMVPSSELSSKVSYPARTFFLNYAQIGCGLSHISLLKQLASDPIHTFYLIFEDDVYFRDFEKTNYIYQLYKSGKLDIDFLSLYCMKFAIQCQRNGNRIELGNQVTIEEKYEPMGCSSYFVTKQGAQKFLNKFSKLSYTIDFQLWWGTSDYQYYNTTTDYVGTGFEETSTIANQGNFVSRFLPVKAGYYVSYPALALNKTYTVTFFSLGFFVFSLIALFSYFYFKLPALFYLFLVLLVLSFVLNIS